MSYSKQADNSATSHCSVAIGMLNMLCTCAQYCHHYQVLASSAARVIPYIHLNFNRTNREFTHMQPRSSIQQFGILNYQLSTPLTPHIAVKYSSFFPKNAFPSVLKHHALVPRAQVCALIKPLQATLVEAPGMQHDSLSLHHELPATVYMQLIWQCTKLCL